MLRRAKVRATLRDVGCVLRSSCMASDPNGAEGSSESERRKQQAWRRILLLVIAITVHNFPEGQSLAFPT